MVIVMFVRNTTVISILRANQCCPFDNIFLISVVEKIAKRLVTDGGAVAFHATVDGLLSSNHQAGETVVFETVKLNLGGGYDGTTGVFTCPTDGVYIFSTSIMTYHGTQTDVEKTRVHTAIMKNGEEIASAFASGGSGEMEQGSVSAAIELVRGDEVEVKFQRRNNMLMWGDKLTSFMGVLVTPL